MDFDICVKMCTSCSAYRTMSKSCVPEVTKYSESNMQTVTDKGYYMYAPNEPDFALWIPLFPCQSDATLVTRSLQSIVDLYRDN